MGVKRWFWVGAMLIAAAVGCTDDDGTTPDTAGTDAAVDSGPDTASADAETTDTGQVGDTGDAEGRADGGLEGDESFAGQLRRPVEVVEDDFGMKHIFAESLEDLFFMNGYTYASDRFGQMEYYRRIATGTLSEILGQLDSRPIRTDIMLRTLGLKRSAKKFWEQNYDPDKQSYVVVEEFCRGVNAYLEERRNGQVDESAPVQQLFPPAKTPDWEPSDVLAVGKLLALQLTYAADAEIEISKLRDEILATYGPKASQKKFKQRAGLLHDLLRFEPSTDTTHLDGFPDSGEALSVDVAAPEIARDTYADAIKLHDGLRGLGIGADTWLGTGSNNWTLSGQHTASGHPNVANDPHLGLDLPTIFYPIHLRLKNDIDGREPIEVVGASILGLPGVVVGRNNQVAWGTTVGFYDYVDVYQEKLTGPQGGSSPAKVKFKGATKPVETVTERIKVGSLGNISESASFDLNLEIVPHHGPILPEIGEDGRPEARTDNKALSVRWVGLEANNEFKFLTRLWRAETPDDVEEALDYYSVGSSNFVFGFTNGDIFYSGQSDIPVRPPGAMTFDPRPKSQGGNPRGTMPIFVLPGQGKAEWDGFVPETSIPHAKNPEDGYIVTANNDQVGTTLDNDPLNDAYYLGAMYASGYRAERISTLIENPNRVGDGDGKLSLQEQTAIQNDNKDLVARQVVPHIVEAMDTVLDESTPDSARPDLGRAREILNNSFEDEGQFRAYRDLLDGWDYRTPGTRMPTGEDADRSAAATLFNVTMVELIRHTLGDEFAAIGRYNNGYFDVPQSGTLMPRVLVWLLEHPDEAQTWEAGVGESRIFDDMATPKIRETRVSIILRALATAKAALSSDLSFAKELNRTVASPNSADPADWVWGDLHGLALGGLLPIGDYARPESGLPFFPRGGGEFAVSPCNHGYNDYDFICGSGSSLRMVHDMDPDGPTTYNAIPGGYSMNPGDDSYFSEFDRWQEPNPRKLETDRATLQEEGEATTYVP